MELQYTKDQIREMQIKALWDKLTDYEHRIRKLENIILVNKKI